MREPLLPLPRLDRAAAILSLDAELMWGYLDLMDEAAYQRRYPSVTAAYRGLVRFLCERGIAATWFLVGGMALEDSQGPQDPRMAGLPAEWVRRVKAGSEATQPLWYDRSLIGMLQSAQPRQEIGLHGGLTHFIWNGASATPEVLRWELVQGLTALERCAPRPRSFSFPRTMDAHYELLVAHGFSSFRGRPLAFPHRLGRTLPGAVLRMLGERTGTAVSPVYPYEHRPGLWNIPASLFLYPIGKSRSVLVPLRLRVERFRRGLEAAIRAKALFHYCFHPANLAESPLGFSLLGEMLEILNHARRLGDVEIVTVDQLTRRLAASPVAAEELPVPGLVAPQASMAALQPAPEP